MEEKKRLLEFVKPGTGERLSFRNKQYFVTEDGHIWNDAMKRYLAQRETKDGYLTVSLRDNNGTQHTRVMVHNLVATCFMRLLEKGEQVHHRDKNPKNNKLSNLEIIDASEHHRMHWKDGTMNGHGEKVAAKLRNVGNSYRPAKQVAQLDMNGNLIHVWPSTAECGRNGYDFSSISACCRNCYSRPGNNVYKGYRWQYLECYLASQPVQIEIGN